MDAILNISKRSMMPEWHQLDSSSAMPRQQESTKKKTLKSSHSGFPPDYMGFIFVNLSDVLEHLVMLQTSTLVEIFN